MNSAAWFRWLLLFGLAAALAAGAVLAVRGEWAQFGASVWALPAGWKQGGYRRAYLEHWILPALGAYVIVLCGGIFFGLRRLRSGAR
jgi:hypothetical protein